MENLIKNEFEADIVILGQSPAGPVAFLVPKQTPIHCLRKHINEQYIRIVFVSRIPRNEVTGKVDRRKLLSHLESGGKFVDKEPIDRCNEFIVKYFQAGFILACICLLSLSLLRILTFPYVFLFFLYFDLGRASRRSPWLKPVVSGYARCIRWIPISRFGVSFVLAMVMPMIIVTLTAACGVYVAIHNRHRSIHYVVSWQISFWIGAIREVQNFFEQRVITEKGQKAAELRVSESSSNRVHREWINEQSPPVKVAKRLSISEPESFELFKILRQDGGVQLHRDSPRSETLAVEFARILEETCNHLPVPLCPSTSLSTVTSLTAVMIANKFREKFQILITVRDVLSCETVGDLVRFVDTGREHVIPIIPARRDQYRCQIWGWGFACKWLFELTDPPDSKFPWIHYNSLYQTLEILAERHEAFQVVPVDPLVYAYWMNEVYACWGVLQQAVGKWARNFFGTCIAETCSRVTRTASDRKIYLRWNKDFSSIDELKEYMSSSRFYPPIDAEILTVGKRQFFKLFLTHAFSDGSSVVPILRDLNLIYSAIVLGKEVPHLPPPMSGLALQESRLVGALKDSNEHDSLYLCYNMDAERSIDRRGFSRTVLLEKSLTLICHSAANRNSCPLDVLLLAAVCCAWLRWLSASKSWSGWLSISIIAPLRDSPEGASDCVGFLADLRNIDVFLGSDPSLCTYRCVLDSLHAIRRKRAWKLPTPLSSCDRPLVNIVPANFSAPFSVDLVTLQNESMNCSVARPIELYVEQLAETNWALRGRCRLFDFASEDSFFRLADSFKDAVVALLVYPDTPIVVDL
jgi:acyl carrier protein